MVSGEEKVFDNVYEARDYILAQERYALSKDFNRQVAPCCYNSPFDRREIPFDSLDYPFSAYFNNAEDSKFIMSRLCSGRYSLKPNLRNRKFLFRGECEFHSPCSPNLFRNPSKKYFLDDLIRGDEMVMIILSHPLVQLLDLGVKLNGRVYRFDMNLYGLLQHYYNKSSLLDLTSDIDVAVFFATQKYDSFTDTYLPIVDENCTAGVLYYYDIDIDRDFKRPDKEGYLSTIGLQVFPRSGCQKGFVYNLNQGYDFNCLPQLRAVRFKHNAKIANEISVKMHSGRKLFPIDILETHWRQHLRPNVLSKDAIRINITRNRHETLSSLEAQLKNRYQIDSEEYKPELTKDELREYYYELVYNSFWKNFCEQIFIPGDSEGAMMRDLLNLPYSSEYEWAFKENVSTKLDYREGYLLNEYKDILAH